MDRNNQNEASWLGRIFARIKRWIRNYFVFVGVITTILLILVIRAAVQYSRPGFEPPLPGSAQVFLHIKLEGRIEESAPGGSLSERLYRQMTGQPAGPYILDFKSGLERAANDPKVKGLYLEVNDLSGSLASFTELRRAFVHFKETSKKPIYAWLASGENKTYYFASLADQLFVAPAGELTIPGPAMEQVYFAEALKKLGVVVEVVRDGKFKSAVEPFILNAPSPESTTMHESLERNLRAHLASLVNFGRHFENAPRAEEWFRQGLFSPQSAKKAGVVDDIAYADDVKEKLAKDLSAEAYEYDKYRHSEDPMSKLSDTFSEGEGIGLIEAIGEIHMHMRGSDEAIVPEDMRKELEWARKEDKVKAVVLRISSPGGAATAADIIWDGVRKLAAKKPVVVSMGAYAASGGYYIAAPATKIIALPTTITGSIGVFGLIPKFTGFEEKYGISFHVFTDSERKNLLNPGKPSTPEDLQALAQMTDQTYQTFLQRVAQGRSMKVEEVDAIAQGRVWTGAQAKELGLVDELGGLLEALQEAKKLANIPVDTKVPILRYQPTMRSLSDCLRNIRSCLPMSSVAMKYPLSQVQRLQEKLEHFEEEHVQALWTGSWGRE